MNKKQPHASYPPDRRILRIAEVIERCGYKRRRIYQLIESGDFPKPVPIGPKAVGWNSHEIDEWIAKQIDK